ncbi:fibrocystin-L-like isoform X2 [Clavelina lepadiformis]|uniref:fibrocystin-L-like isoform X2 n=1 Tax=Clavelina lepadiformis TaxID=159417 RepID=UPI00404157C9
MLWSTIFVVVLLRTAVSGQDPTISSIQPRRGGRGGATRIQIFGSDFPSAFSLSGNVIKQVRLVSDHKEYECELHDAESDEKQTVCYTPTMTVGTYYVRMTVHNLPLKDSSYCGGNTNSWSCSFLVYDYRTPFLTALSWTSGEPTNLIVVSGRTFTNLVSSNEAEATNGNTASIIRVWSTSGKTCNLFGESGEPYNIALNGEDGESNWGSFTCLLEGSYVGSQNISFIVDPGYGRSEPYKSAVYVDANDALYMLQTYAVINDVSPKTGSLFGGTTLTISGNFFDDSSGIKARVLVGGQPCTVQSVTTTEIKCVTPEQPTDQKLYSGGRGFNLEDLSYWTDKMEVNNINGDSLVSRVRGFFVPSTTGQYRFTVLADDQIRFYINPTGNDPDGKELAIELTTANIEKTSETPYTLTAGTEYYYEISHLEDDYSAKIKLSAYVDRTNYSPDQTGWSFNEIQHIKISSDVQREIQTIRFENWVTQTATQSTWTVMLSCSDTTTSCIGSLFHFSLFGTKSGGIMYGATGDQVKVELQKMAALAKETVEVTKSDDQYSIIFQSSRGQMPLVAESNNPSLSITLSETTTGVPDLATFTFSINNLVSAPVTYATASTSDVAAAVSSLFGPKCPNSLERGIGHTVGYYHDFESEGWTYGGVRTSEESFCGVRSVKNPTYIFKDDEQPAYSLSQNPFVCFAYKGRISNQLRVVFTYVDSTTPTGITVDKDFYTVGLVDSTEEPQVWRHFCYDLKEKLQLDYPSGRNFRINDLLVVPVSEEDLYLDNVFIGGNLESDDEARQDALGVIIPPAVPNIKIESIEVTKDTNSYTMTFVPVECGYEFPLIGFAFSEISETTSTDHKYVFGSDADTSPQVHVSRDNSASPPVTGTFDLSFEDSSYGQLTGLAANIEAEDLQIQLQTLSKIDHVEVIRSDNCHGYDYQVKFTSPNGDYPSMTADGMNLEAKTHPVNVIVTLGKDGGLYMSPIHGDFVRTAHEKPQVQVFINDIPSLCSGHFNSDSTYSCDFEWTSEATPEVTSVSPSSVSAGDTITIEGSGFTGTISSAAVVLVGGVLCAVTAIDDTNIQCRLGNSPSGEQPIALNIVGKGSPLIASGSSIAININGRIDAISPNIGSRAGCTRVTITGSGFDSTSEVTIGGSPCSGPTAEYSSITCTAPDAPSTGSVPIVVTTGGIPLTMDDAYTYASPSATITSISSNLFTVDGGTEVTIIGSGFGITAGQVLIGDVAATVSSWSDTSINIMTPSLAAGTYYLKVVVGEDGCAGFPQSVTYEFSISSITPDKGSLAGGTTVTLTGSGFTNDTAVRIGDVTCGDVIVTSDNSLLTCVTEPGGATHLVSNTGTHPTYGLGYGWNPSTVNMKVGDLLSVHWSISAWLDKSVIGLYSTDSAMNNTYDGEGFQAPVFREGKYQYRFNKVGKFHFSSGCIDSPQCQVYMRLAVEVTDATNKFGSVSATLGNLEITCDTCLYTFDTAETPIVTNISPNTGTTATTIAIQGTGFSTPTTVKVGGKTCEVTGTTTTAITCQILASEELAVGIYHPVVVNVDGNGDALLQMQSKIKRSFALTPLITGVSPNMGSLAGGTKITIQGSGFTTQSEVKIAEQKLCDVIEEESTYTSLVCVTQESTAISGNIDVTVGVSDAQCAAGVDCSFEFAETATPVVTGRTTNEDFSALSLTLDGTNFGTDTPAVTVTLSSGMIMTSCTITSVTDTQIGCDLVSRLPVGTNEISVSITGAKGLASFDDLSHKYIVSPNRISDLTPESGSVNGGTTLTITGNGFVKVGISVQVGRVPCVIIDVTLSIITCTTDAHEAGQVSVKVESNEVTYPTVSYEYSNAATPTIANVFPVTGAGGDSITLTGTQLGNVVGDVSVTVGGIECTVTSAGETTLECTLGDREGGHAIIEVTVASLGLAMVSSSVSFVFNLGVHDFSPKTGSYGGSQLVTIDGAGFSNHTIVRICDLPCTLESSSSTQITCRTSANQDYVDSSSSTTCEVKVTNEAQIEDFAITAGSNYTYSGAQTPTITGVTPERGGTGGGTEITITGSGFTMTSIVPKVSIDGSDCVISAFTDTSIICQTSSHKGSIKTKVTVRVGDHGIATQDGADFFYIDRWSSVFTWGGKSLPTDEDFVIIQAGQTVLLDTHTAVLKMLLIDGGELIFDEAEDANVSLRAENILIVNNGRLQVGTEAEPYKGKAEIVMYGHLRSPELPIYGAKTLGLRSGTLDLHGRHILNPWSVLAATADVGATQITLKHTLTNWQVGDEIVIASTGTRHSQRENEKRKITNISGLTITMDSALEYKHLGVTEVLADGTEVEFRAEVGLLSRNVVFRGTNDVAWNDEIEACEAGFQTGQFATQTCFQGRFGEEEGSDQFGGSIFIHSSEPNSDEIEAKIENIEVTYAGQAFRLGRYPIHFHLMGDVSGMYVKRCAIHNTFNRAVTIHGTHNLLVDSNVVYDVMGGAIFIEDGIETGNTIQYNLAVFVRQSTSLLNDDITPAAYWVTNPNNTLRHNHAAGGTHFGFWYRMHEHPDGPSYTPTVCQQKVELGEFRNNTVHSQGWFGLWIFQTYFPMKGSSCDSTEPSPAKFDSLTTWHCEKGAEWVNCGAIQFNNFVMVNNEDTGIDIKLISGTAWGDAKITNVTIVGHSSQSDASHTRVGITLPLAPGFFVDGAKFINFDTGGVALIGTTIQGTCSVFCGGFYYWFARIEYDSVTKRIHWRWPHEGVLVDRDGSLTADASGASGTAGTTVVPYTGLVNTDDCPVWSDDLYSSGVQAAICKNGNRFHRFALNNALPSSLDGKDMVFVNSHGNATSSFLKKRLTHKPGWMALLPNRDEIFVYFENGDQFTNITYNAKLYDFQQDDYVILKHNLTQTPDVIQINGQGNTSVGDTSELTATSSNLDWHFDEDNKELSIMVSGRTESPSRKRRATLGVVQDDYKHISVSPTIYRCFYEKCVEPLSPEQVPPERERPEYYSRLSNLSNPCATWSDDNRILTINHTTTDGESCWVVADVSSINVDSIIIEGVLEFDRDTNVSAITILVLRGRIIAGVTETEPFAHKLQIELRGNHDTERVALPGINLGSKAIGCFGGCDFHGKKRSPSWTRLAQTVTAGTNQIIVQDVVDWVAGEEIVITTTGYDSQETEKHVIAAVADDRRTITLRDTLTHRHMGETYTVGQHSYDMKAEVGLLTRSIKIIGQLYDDIDKEAYGARVLVGSVRAKDVNNEDVQASGFARFSNVEFYRTGQEGWTDPWDPRFSLAWVGTGAAVPARPAFVKNCAFHDGYSTAIGTFGADDVNITGNVVHRTIFDGIRLTGAGHQLVNNLVTVTLFRGTWGDRMEWNNFVDWHASFEVAEASSLIMKGNVAAGSERRGFHIDGEACDAPEDDNAWTGNVAHGCLHGIQIFTADGVGSCSMIRNFVVYKSWDYGIYHQTQVSVHINNTVIADSFVGYLPYIFAPAALSHEQADKFARMENVLCVGRSQHFDPDLDKMDEQTDKNLRVRNYGPTRQAPRNIYNGKTCVMLPMFQSGPNGAPFKAFNLNKNYPSVRGLLDIDGLHAQNYNLNSDGTRDLIFFTNPSNEDIFHPTYLRNIVLSNVDEDSKVYYARPSIGKINPSDCVDMECDGMKNALIKDFDGGFIGGTGGSVIPQAEYGWDVDPVRGLGDYRIPKAMLTTTSGDRIPVNNIIGGRGIFRDPAECTLNLNWQAYRCPRERFDHRMLVIESLDPDTETRRLSPLALLSERYIDLFNGPQDHGWCFGYTCQKRISTFYTIVATGHHYDVYFTGYAPKNLRLTLLNVDDDITLRVAIWYARPEKLEVFRYNSDDSITPENYDYDVDNDKWIYKRPETDGQYRPAINSRIHGANFMDLKQDLLYVTLRGGEPIDIKTAPAVILAFGFPAISIDEFFGENLISNLAIYLGVPDDKIRIVDVVEETSSRKRRSTTGGTVTYMIQFSDEISNSSVSGSDTLAAEVLNNKTDALLLDYQTGHLWELLNVTEGSSLSTSVASTSNTSGDAGNETLVQHSIPTQLVVSSLPSSAEEYVVFDPQPMVSILDADNQVVSTLGGNWMVTVSLNTSATNAVNEATLMGNTTVEVSNGYASFTDLRITHSGTGYILIFSISAPSGISLTTTDPTIDISLRTVNIGLPSGVEGYIEHNNPVDITLELQDVNGVPLEKIGYKGHTWKVDISLDDSSIYGTTGVDGTTTFTFDSTTGRTITTGLTLTNTISYYQYNLRFRVYTDPALYDFAVEGPTLQFTSSSDDLHTSATNIKKLKIEFVGQPYTSKTSSSSKSVFTAYFHNTMVQKTGVLISNTDASEISNGNTEVSFDVGSSNATAVDIAVTTVSDFLVSDNGLSFQGSRLVVADTSCVVTIDGTCDTDTSVTSTTTTKSWIYVVVGVVMAIVLAAGIIAFSCVMKRAKMNKVGGTRGCFDANSSRGASPILDSFYTSSSASSATPDLYNRRPMTSTHA